MLKLNTKEENLDLLNNLTRLINIYYYDGPIVVLYNDIRNNDLYIVDWIDHDDIYNRWLVYKVTKEKLLQFLNKQVDELRLFNMSNEYYIIDVKDEFKFSKLFNIDIDDIPFEYYPVPIFYDEDNEETTKGLKFILNNLDVRKHNSPIINEIMNEITQKNIIK